MSSHITRLYTNKLKLIFKANNPQELQQAFHKLYGMHSKLENLYRSSSEVDKVYKSIHSTMQMFNDELPFRQILGKMHADLQTYKNLIKQGV